MKFLNAGDSAIIVELGNEISPLINSKIKKITAFLDSLNTDGIRDLLPTYRSIIVYFDPLKISAEDIEKQIVDNCNINYDVLEEEVRDIVEIPVMYGGEYGPDIENIANVNNLSVEEVIKIHSSGEYLVYMLGFTAGFPYLGGMDKSIATPRLKEPRLKIPGGSVGIAGEQTGIYPLESPGGWQLLGRTPLELFNPNKENPCLLNVGEYIKFVPVDEDTYLQIEREVKSGIHKEKRYRK
ncbi:5-oxoprolinase subunit PxpB [Fusobacterium sp. PH5-44]|uniref:5-oxoprolinase subunit PxpB n=1 Tax=unclassified Fusobacterium TaxID=2648384 RepID=UPI003D1BA7E4